MTHPPDCSCVCHTGSAAFPPPCDVPGGCGSAAAEQAAPAVGAAAGQTAGQSAERTPPARPLAELVAELVDQTTVRVRVEKRDPTDGHLVVERPERPVRPVLAELREAKTPSGQAGGGGRGGGLPLSLEALDVYDQIAGVVDTAMAQLGMRHRGPADCEWCGTTYKGCRSGAARGADGLHHRMPGPHFPDGPRCCSRHWHREPDRLEDALRRLAVAGWPAQLHPARDSFGRQLATLTGRARAVLAGDGQDERVRDTRCPRPRCHAEYLRVRPDVRKRCTTCGAAGEHCQFSGPGTPKCQPSRVPPLRVIRSRVVERDGGELVEGDARRGPVRGTRCDACGTFWPWEEMQGPRPGQPTGALWELLVADALRVAEERAHVDHWAAELVERRARYTDGDRPTALALGLPVACLEHGVIRCPDCSTAREVS